MSESPPEPLGLFDDGKAQGAMRTIGEVARALGVKSHVLRYWEQHFPMLRPLQRSGGRRHYRPEDVALIARIDALVNKRGFTLKGARQAIEQEGADPAASLQPRHDPASRGSQDVLPRLRAIRHRLATALAG